MAADNSKQALSLSEERKLIRRIQRGDNRAFRTLYQAFAQDLYSRIIFPKIPVQDVAEDILRETFLTAMERIDRFRWQDRSIKYWLRRIAANKVIDHFRSNQRATRFLANYKASELEISPASGDNPERQLADLQTHERLASRLHDVLEELNPRYRRAIELRFFEERSRQACADELDITVGTFDVLLFRAIKRLKQLYERHHETHNS